MRAVAAVSVLVCFALATLCACSAGPAPQSGRGRGAPTFGLPVAGGGVSNPQPSAASGTTGFGSAPTPIVPPAVTPPGPGAASDGATVCATAELELTRVVPTVWLLIDGSGSMAAPLMNLLGPSRWALLHEALVADGTGLVPRLQSSVKFGLYVYDGGLSLPGIPGPQCPRTVVTEPALNNASAIAGAYPVTETGASTPTHYALLDLKKRIDARGPSADGPTYVVLATDGKPNLCDFHDGIPASPATENEAVDTVAQLANAGTKVFVISMAGSDADLQSHLQAVSAAGKTGTQPFTPATQDELIKSLTQIIGATASCDVRIQGHVAPGRECTGSVSMNGTPLLCNDPNGYRLNDDRRSLELVGSACATLQLASAPTLKATFPCDDIVLL